MLVAESKVPPPAKAEPPDAARSWNQIVEQVNPFLHAVNERLIRQANDFDPQVVPYAQAALNGSGKHLRPTLVALAGSAVGRAGDAHITAAVIIEMVHLATLVHDDVMDEAQIRRGQLTIAANWGNEIAVLFGEVNGTFSDAAYKISKRAKPVLFREGWQKIFELPDIREQVRDITRK